MFVPVGAAVPLRREVAQRTKTRFELQCGFRIPLATKIEIGCLVYLFLCGFRRLGRGFFLLRAANRHCPACLLLRSIGYFLLPLWTLLDAAPGFLQYILLFLTGAAILDLSTNFDGNERDDHGC